MKVTYITLIAVLILSCSSTEPLTDKEAVIHCFDNYKEAVSKRKGKEAAKWIDKSTLDKYSQLLDHAINTKWEVLTNLSLMDKLTVLTIRNHFNKTDAYRSNGSKVFAFAVNEGLFGTDDILEFELGEFNLNNNLGAARLMKNGELAAGVNFIKEGEEWKIIPLSLHPYTIEQIAKYMDENGVSEDGYIMQALKEQNGGEEVGSEIFKPLKTR